MNRESIDYQQDFIMNRYRFFDLIFSISGLILLSPLLLILLLVGLFDTKRPLFIQERVGRHERPFRLAKLRTMKVGTASVATHLAQVSSITPYGRFLRKTKLDELPQLWNVMLGDMSLVGPRPCLFQQEEVIAHRKANNLMAIKPGVTGLSQIRGIDMSTPELLAKTDAEMITSMTLKRYFHLLVLTVTGSGQGDRVLSDSQ